MSDVKVTICECGLARSFHDGDNAPAYRPSLISGKVPCKGYKPRLKNWWNIPRYNKKEQRRVRLDRAEQYRKEKDRG